MLDLIFSDQWFEAKRNIINQQETHLSTMEKVITQLIRSQKEMAQGYAELEECAAKISSIEADHNNWLSSQLSNFAQASSLISVLLDKLVNCQILDVEERFKDYAKVFGAVKEMLAVRNEKLSSYQTLGFFFRM